VSALTDAGLVKIALSYLNDQGVLCLRGAVIPAETQAAILKLIDEAVVG
jgi:hypothetical protein